MSINYTGDFDGFRVPAERNRPGTDVFGTNDLPRLVLRPGSHIGDADQPGDCCYLIERGLVASYIDVDGIRPTCVGLAGPGDMIGLNGLFGRSSDTAARAQAVGSVQLLRISVSGLRDILNRSPALLDTCLQQLQASMTETQHIAACNARHLLPARCAHWLLRLKSQLGGDVLPVTHEFLASVLGVRRAGITVTLQALQRSGAIRQQRGNIAIIDAAELRATACGCPLCVARPPWVMPASEIRAPCITPRPEGGGPRAWVNAAIQERATSWRTGNPSLIRIEAALRVCHRVMDRTQGVLTA